MADKKQQTPTEKAAEGRDPTVRSLRGASAYPEGTHPPVSPSDATWGPDRFSYSDLSADEKPDESTVAQELDSDPVQDDNQAALRESSEQAAKDANDAARGSSKK
jgi:hypothetical protein